MILPNKHISMEFSLLGIGGKILAEMNQPQTVSSLWEAVKSEIGVATFERFTLSLSLLFAIGAIDLNNGLLVRKDVAT